MHCIFATANCVTNSETGRLWYIRFEILDLCGDTCDAVGPHCQVFTFASGTLSDRVGKGSETLNNVCLYAAETGRLVQVTTERAVSQLQFPF